MARSRSATRRLRDATLAVEDHTYTSEKSAQFIGTATYAHILMPHIALCAAHAGNHDDECGQEWALNQDFPLSGSSKYDHEDISYSRPEDLYDGPENHGDECGQEWALNQDFPLPGSSEYDHEDISYSQPEALYDGPILYDEYDGMPLDPRDGSRLYDTFEEIHLYDEYDGTPLHPYDGSRLYTPRQPKPSCPGY